MESQVAKLRGEKEKEGILLAPSNMLSGAKTLARKVVGQLGNDSDRLHDSLEDSMKRVSYSMKIICCGADRYYIIGLGYEILYDKQTVYCELCNNLLCNAQLYYL